MKPALHAALLVAALLGVVVSFGWIVRAGDETCGTVGKEDAFHCSHFAETLGLVGFYGSGRSRSVDLRGRPVDRLEHTADERRWRSELTHPP